MLIYSIQKRWWYIFESAFTIKLPSENKKTFNRSNWKTRKYTICIKKILITRNVF